MKLNNRIFLMLGIASVFSLNNFAAMCVTYHPCTQPSNEGTYCQHRGFNHKKCKPGCWCQGHRLDYLGDEIHKKLDQLCRNKNATEAELTRMNLAGIYYCPVDTPDSPEKAINANACKKTPECSVAPVSGKYCRRLEAISNIYDCPAGCYCVGTSDKHGTMYGENFIKDICKGTVEPGADTFSALSAAGINRCPAGYRKGGTGAKAITECKNASSVSYTPNNNNSNSFTKPGYTGQGSFTVVSGGSSGGGSGGSSGGGTGYQQLDLPGDFQQKIPSEIGEHTVTYSCGDGLGITDQNYTQTSVNGRVTTLLASVCVAQNGGIFDYWQCDSTIKNENSSLFVTTNTTCVAIYRYGPSEFKVTFDCENPEASTELEQKVTYKTIKNGRNFELKKSFCSYDNWTLNGWVCDHNLANGEEINVNYPAEHSLTFNAGADVECVAQWTDNENSVVCSQLGFYLKAGEVTCDTPCPAGYYCPGNGTTYEKKPSEDKGKLPCEGENEYSGSRAAQCSQCEDGYHANTNHTGCVEGSTEFDTTRTITVPAGYYLPSSSVDPSHTPTECEWLDINDDLYDDVRDDEFCPGGSFKVSTTHDAKGIYHCVAGGTHANNYKSCKVQLSKDELEHGILGEGECWLAETADEYKDCVFYGARDVKPNN